MADNKNLVDDNEKLINEEDLNTVSGGIEAVKPVGSQTSTATQNLTPTNNTTLNAVNSEWKLPGNAVGAKYH